MTRFTQLCMECRAFTGSFVVELSLKFALAGSCGNDPQGAPNGKDLPRMLTGNAQDGDHEGHVCEGSFVFLALSGLPEYRKWI